MKKRIGLLVLTLGIMMSGINVWAAEKEDTKIINSYFNLFLDEVKGVQSEESISSLKESVEELIQDIKPEDAKKIFDFIAEKIDEGKLDSEGEIKEAIAEAEKEFNVTLTKEQKEKIIAAASKIKDMGISPEYLLKEAEKIYDKYSSELKEELNNEKDKIIEEAQNKIKEEVNKSVSNYFSDMVNNVKSFFKGIFKK